MAPGHGLDSSAQRQWTKAYQDQHPSPLLPTAPPLPLTPGVFWAAAEILTPSARFSRYIYVSTRDTGVQTPAGDSIAILENVGQGTPGEKLQLVMQVFTGLDQLDAVRWRRRVSECWPVAGMAAVLIYQRLTQVARKSDIPTSTSFVWA